MRLILDIFPYYVRGDFITDTPNKGSIAPKLPSPKFFPQFRKLLRYLTSRHALQYPIQRVCCHCQTKDDFDLVRLSDSKGDLFTFTKEMGQGVDYPRIWSVVELEGRCRFFCILTDRDPERVEVGMPMEMTFRRESEGGGFHNYLWKCRPPR